MVKEAREYGLPKAFTLGRIRFLKLTQPGEHVRHRLGYRAGRRELFVLIDVRREHRPELGFVEKPSVAETVGPAVDAAQAPADLAPVKRGLFVRENLGALDQVANHAGLGLTEYVAFGVA